MNETTIIAAPHPEPNHAMLIIVMGVSGTGKSTLGKALADRLSIPFIDGDDLHPKANVEKMSAGEPLTDADRKPWLELIRATGAQKCMEQAAEEKRGCVIACSALKRVYRDILRGTTGEDLDGLHPRVYFVFLRGSREVLLDRMEARHGHFMKGGMLDSQLKTLEDPEGEEGVVVVPVEGGTEEQVETAREWLEIR